VVTFANDVENEAHAARHLPDVIGGVWRETCTRLGDARVRFLSRERARAVLGRHPRGIDAGVLGVAALLRAGGVDVGLSEDVSADKWLKLCVNLTSAPNALVRRDEHATPAFVETKVRLLREAQRALALAGVRAASCDSRDRSLEEEIRHHETSLARGVAARGIPLFNQVWSSLRSGAPLEADAYHRRILTLAAAHGEAAPANERVLERLLHAAQAGLGPECYGAGELLP
jgi:2-dehydropantoate 2-reductase